jgi:hypothetical protein
MLRLVFLLVSLVFTAGAGTITITPSVSFNGPDYTYSYAISYVPDAAEGIYQVTFYGLDGLVPFSESAPTNWTFTSDYTANQIAWVSDDPSFDIFSGPLNGFAFRSTQAPGTVAYEITTEDINGTLPPSLGFTTGPVNAVPEPSTFLVSAFALAFLSRRRKPLTLLALFASVLGMRVAVQAAPVVVVRVKDAPTWAPDVTIRAARNAQLDASSSTGTGPLTFAWAQLSGPNTLRWLNRNTAQPTITGAVFGTYEVRVSVTDGAGTSTANLRFGAVGTDDAGVVTPPSSNAAFLYAPMIRFGASAWPWLDERNRALADGFAQKLNTDARFNASDWDTALPGTLSANLASFTVTGNGTQFQTDFCGGAGLTSVVADRQLVVWYSLPSGGTGRRNIEITGCPSQTSLTLRYQWPLPTAESQALAYSRQLCFSCWTSGSNHVNYYDLVLAYYSLYYRSGRVEYRDMARTLAHRWYRSISFDEGRVFPGRLQPPRDLGLLGLMWWALDVNPANFWPNVYPLLDHYASTLASPGIVGDPREEAFVLAYLSGAARLAPDAAKRQQYATSIVTSLTVRWVPSQQPSGAFYQTMPYQAGTLSVVNGSSVVTLSGATVSPGFFQSNFNLWVANDLSGSSGDATTYLNPTYLNATQIQLPRAYEGPTSSGRPWQYFVFTGRGAQPFFQGMIGRAMDLAHRATNDARARQINHDITNWLLTVGAQNSTGGFYYGRAFRNCEPIQDAIPWCSYNPAVAQDISDSRYNLSLMLGGFSGSYAVSSGNNTLSAVDFLTGATLGRLGGPNADFAAHQDLDSSVSRNWFKDLGIFFGFGQAYSWPAARTGTATSKILGN